MSDCDILIVVNFPPETFGGISLQKIAKVAPPRIMTDPGPNSITAWNYGLVVTWRCYGAPPVSCVVGFSIFLCSRRKRPAISGGSDY